MPDERTNQERETNRIEEQYRKAHEEKNSDEGIGVERQHIPINYPSNRVRPF